MNGRVVVDQGRHAGVLAGCALRRGRAATAPRAASHELRADRAPAPDPRPVPRLRRAGDPPRAAEIDRTDGFPWDLYKRMAELDILGMTVPPEYGGSGADVVSWCIAQEELARESAVVSDAQLLCKLM